MTLGGRSATKAALSVVLTAALVAFVPTPVSAAHGDNWVITTDTTLTADFTGHIYIGADDITLDCAGFKVIGPGVSGSGGSGIVLPSVTGVTIKNCVVERFRGYGFAVLSPASIAANNLLTNNTAIQNHRGGFYLEATNTNTLTNNLAWGSAFTGFKLFFASSNTLTGNTAKHNGYHGFYVHGNGNILENNRDENLVTSSSIGFYVVSDSSSNTLFHNIIIDAFDGNTASNNWHHPVLEEGNFWADYTGVDDGSGTGKHAIAGDGIGDTLLPHPGPGYDNFPVISESGIPVPTDNAPPTTTATESGTAGMASWFVSPVAVTLSAIDDLSGVASTFYRIESGVWTNYAGPFTLYDGIQTVEYYSTDNAGNAETVKSSEVKIDTVGPVTEYLLNGATGGAEPGWYTRPQTVSLTASDSESGVASVAYRIDAGGWETYGAPFAMSDGIHTVDYYSTDVAGNEEVVNSFGIEIDTTSPTLSITSPVAGEALATGEIMLIWTATDATSGINYFEISIDGGKPVILTVDFALTYTFTGVADGAHNITIVAFDMAENSVVLSVEFTVDTSIPTGPSDSVGLLLIGISVAVIAGAVAAVFLLIRRRRAKKGSE